MGSSFAVRTALAAAGGSLLFLPAVAQGAVPHPTVAAQAAVKYTPELVPSDIARPRVNAIAVAGARTYAGGLFDTVTQQGEVLRGLGNLMSFTTATGVLDRTFKPRFDGPVWAIEPAPGGGVFVGGDFTQVDGTARAGLVKLTASGAVDTRFKPYFKAGQVNDLEVATIRGERRLVVAGTTGKRLAAVDTNTGANTWEIDAVFTEPIPGARGAGTAVFRTSVSPDGRRLIATGNFTTVTVDGVSRARRAFVMLTLPTSTRETAIDPWYYPGFAKECSATTEGDARRTANLQGVDWSPDGRHFNVTATGKIPLPGDVWHAWDTDAHNAGSSVCDAVARFSLADPQQAVWMNYSGGDSIWTVQDTGAAVYAQGHFQYMDNPDGFASKPIGDRRTGAPAMARRGVVAINPATGKAITAWAPPAPARMGGKALVATPSGVWWGSDSLKWNGRARLGLAFTPLP